MIHVDPNHTKSNQPITANSTNIISINDSANICEIEKIFEYPVHSLVHVSPIFNYVIASDPPSPLYDTPAESVKPTGNPNPYNNPPNTAPNVAADPYSDPSFSDSSS